MVDGKESEIEKHCMMKKSYIGLGEAESNNFLIVLNIRNREISSLDLNSSGEIEHL